MDYHELMRAYPNHASRIKKLMTIRGLEEDDIVDREFIDMLIKGE